MLVPLRQRNFALLWIGQVISTIGNWVILVGLPFYVYSLTGSALATGTMFIAQTLPRVLFGSLAGTLTDRWNLKRTMIVTDLSRAGLLLFLLLVRSRADLWIVYVIACVEMLISLFFDPAKSALIPRLVAQEDLMAANSLDALSTGITTLIGPSVGGVLVGLLGLTGVVIVDSASYIISGALISLIMLPAPREDEHQSGKPRIEQAVPQAIWREWVDGLMLVRRERALSTVFIVTAIAMIGQGIVQVFLVVFIGERLHGNALEYGWLLAANGLGSLVGGLLVGQLGRTLQPLRLTGIGLVVVSMVTLLVIGFPIFAFDLLLLAIAGVAAMAYVISAQTLLQSHTTGTFRGRVSGSYYNTVSLMMLAGMGLASLLGNALGIVIMFIMAGALFFLAGVVAFLRA